MKMYRGVQFNPLIKTGIVQFLKMQMPTIGYGNVGIDYTMVGTNLGKTVKENGLGVTIMPNVRTMF